MDKRIFEINGERFIVDNDLDSMLDVIRPFVGNECVHELSECFADKEYEWDYSDPEGYEQDVERLQFLLHEIWDMVDEMLDTSKLSRHKLMLIRQRIKSEL